MDYVESSKSTWAGRYSWGDENESSPGLNLNGTKLVTNFEQYMGSNTRVLSPTVVTETRFGYTRSTTRWARCWPSSATWWTNSAFPGLKGGDPVSWGIPSVGIANYNGIGDGTDGPFENKNNTLQFLNNTSDHPRQALVPLRRRNPQRPVQPGGQPVRPRQFQLLHDADAGSRVTPRTAQGDAFASFLLGNVTLTEVAAQIAVRAVPRHQFRRYTSTTSGRSRRSSPSRSACATRTRRRGRTSPATCHGLLQCLRQHAATSPTRAAIPVFLRQGKGSGDPYAGLNVRWPEHPAGAGRTPRQPPGESRQQRLRAAHRASPGARARSGRSAPAPACSTTRTRATRASMSAATPPDARATTTIPTFPPKPGSNGAAGLVGSVANILTPQAFSNKFDRRTPYTMQWLFNVQRELANNLTLRSRLPGFDQPPPGVLSRRQRGGSRTRHGCQPLALSRTSACSCWSKTAATATTTRWARS